MQNINKQILAPYIGTLVLCCSLLLFSRAVIAAEPVATPVEKSEAKASSCARVLFDGQEMMCIKAQLGAFTPQDRAALIERRLKALSDDFTFDVAALTIATSEGGFQINASDSIVSSLRDIDIEVPAGNSFLGTVQAIADRMKFAIVNRREKSTPHALISGVLKSIGATIGLLLMLWLIRWAARRAHQKIANSQGRWIKSVMVKNIELLNASRIIAALSALTSLVRFLITALALYIYLPLVFSFFPWTSGWTPLLYGYISHPLFKIGQAVVDLIPNFFFIAVIFFLTRYILRLVNFFFGEVERGHVVFDGFYSEWSQPTYKLVRVIIIAFAFVMAFPYIPGSNSPAFQGISVFLGLLLSLGSSSAIGNVVAGIVITYMRPFRIGDRVQISDTRGDVIEKNLLVTRIRTIKNVDVTIPNAIVLASHITNYSAHAQEAGLILHTSITIGYDSPWMQIHALLIAAALKTEGIDNSKKPFVLQTALNDFYVEYQINAFTKEPNRMAVISSSLHQNIQDTFNEAKVEIMSSHYSSFRDGNRSTIPGFDEPSSKGPPEKIPFVTSGDHA